MMKHPIRTPLFIIGGVIAGLGAIGSMTSTVKVVAPTSTTTTLAPAPAVTTTTLPAPTTTMLPAHGGVTIVQLGASTYAMDKDVESIASGGSDSSQINSDMVTWTEQCDEWGAPFSGESATVANDFSLDTPGADASGIDMLSHMTAQITALLP